MDDRLVPRSGERPLTDLGGRLWAAELDAHRAEAAEMSARIAERMPVPHLDGSTAAQFGRALRDQMRAIEVAAPGGRDVIVGGVRCREHLPSGTPRATCVQVHGGGMVAGSPLVHDTANAALAVDLGVRVLSVDYRLAPEHPFPAAIDDCVAVLRAALEDPPGPVVLSGTSAGASLSVLAVLRLRDELGTTAGVRGLNLIAGRYDLSGLPSHRGRRPSAVADLLSPAALEVTRELWAPGRSDDEVRDPSMSPLWADLHGLPPALFTVGTGDHVLDDSLFMSQRWRAYGNEAQLAVFPDCGHSFAGLPTELGRRARTGMEDFLRHVLDAPNPR